MTPIAIDVEGAIANALANRTDIARVKKELENIDLGIRLARNQQLPGLDVTANYNVIGVGGTQFVFGQGSRRRSRASRSALRPGAARRLRPGLPDVERAPELQLPDRHEHGGSEPAPRPPAAPAGSVQLQELELIMSTTVRDAARQVETNLRRVEATRKARDRAEQRLAAQEKRMTVGMSTTFELVQAQRDLARQRQKEVNAVIDYNRSIIGFETIQISPAAR